MSRAFSVWLLAVALCAFVGCGGGDATDSGAVADNSGSAAATDGGGASATPAGGANMGAPASTGMGSAGGEGMMGAAGATGMSPEMMMDGSGGASTGDPASGMDMAGFGTADEAGLDPAGPDQAAMAAAYETGAGGAPGAGPPGSSPEEMSADYANAQAGGASAPGSNLGGNYPGGAYPGAGEPAGASAEGAVGAEGYPGGGYPGGPGGPGGGEVEEKVPDGFDGKAQLAFRRGKEKDALQFLYAHALTSDAGAESLLPTIRWVGALRQPKLAVRWGAGFVVTAPRNFNGDPKPVGSHQNIPTREGKRRDGGNEGYVGGGGGAEYGGGEGGGQNDSLLKKGAGELGEKLAAAYTERVMRGDFGDVLKTATEAGSKGNRGNSGGDGAGGYGAEGGPGYGAGGAAGGAGGPSGPGGPGGGGGAADAATKVTQIMPGLSMLGIGTQKELIDRAREDEIDVVVIIDMKLRVNTTNNLVTNDSTLALLDVKTQKKFHTTKAFNNIAIQQLRADDKEDGVDKELEKLFEAIDTNFTMTDLPAGLTAEVVVKRIASLTAETHDNPLPVLAEARMYYSKGLLEESALFAAYEEILGVDFGRMLSTGSEEDKKKVLGRWLPEI